MQEKLSGKLYKLWGIKREFLLKILLLSATYFFLMACHVIWKPLKYSLFGQIVGTSSVPFAKISSLLFLIPLILLYSKLVDWLRRHHLLYFFTISHALGGLFFYYFISHPVYGIANTDTGPSRYIGWLFYFFMESFDAFLSTTFWSFADSVNNANDAKYYYGFFVSGSKIGGMLTAATLYFVLTGATTESQLSIIPNALLIGSCMLFAAAACIYFLVKKVPEGIMHGYEKVYQLEKHKDVEHIPTPTRLKSFLRSITSAFDGLTIMVKSSYVMGIFSLVFFYEIIIAIFDYLVMMRAESAHPSIGSMTAFYALYFFIMNGIGLLISLFGTTPLLRILGIRMSLFAFPLICLIMLVTTFIFPQGWILFGTLIGLRAFNYALNHPTREVLYIPTTKDIKFKAKTWTDAFGSRIAKGFGSFFNLALQSVAPAIALFSSITFSLGLTGIWLVITYFLGKTLQSAIDENRIIGETEESKTNR
ncbi:hypothetical protein K2X40_01645 [Candidatus Babeliales bacterium]|nr:hypothetical protein [Candidatus Babeliales bacterium]